MGYSDFTNDLLAINFGLSVREEVLFPTPGTLEVPKWLQELLEKGESYARVSEKARSEFIVAPVLTACRDYLNRQVQIFSGVRLDVDGERGLKGECDFILARIPPSPFLQAPALVILEAKKNDIEEGYGQCGAQLIAARIFNERHGLLTDFLYGCVTTGEAWHFLRLEGSTLLVDSRRFFTPELGTILWVLTTILQTIAVEKKIDAA